MQDRYNFALVTNHFSSEAESLKFGDTLKRIKSIDNLQVRLHFQKQIRFEMLTCMFDIKKIYVPFRFSLLPPQQGSR